MPPMKSDTETAKATSADDDAQEGSSGTSKDMPFDASHEESKGERSASDEDAAASKAPYERRISKLEDVNKF